MWNVGISAGVEFQTGPSDAEMRERIKQAERWLAPSPSPSPSTSPSKSQGYLSWAWDTLTTSGPSHKHLSSPEAFTERLRQEALEKPKL